MNAATLAVKEAKRLAQDRARYAAWEARGCPPSPPPIPSTRKDRTRPRADKHSMLLRAQGTLCGICCREFDEYSALTLDHVTPRALGGKNSRNLMLAHMSCNSAKGDRPPTREELVRLANVNAFMDNLAR